MRHNKKHLDFEINLIPCIDLLSVCICFLLLTAVWMNLGSVNVKQAVGGQSASETQKKPILWVMLGENGDVSFEAQEASRIPQVLRKFKLAGRENKFDLDGIKAKISELIKAEPELKTALIHPRGSSAYEEIITVMDEVRGAGLTELGVAPL